MKHFVMIFRTTRPFTPEELQRRGPEIQAWVHRVQQMGITLDPRNLDEVVTVISPNAGETVSSNQSKDPSLATIVYFDASSEKEALEVAKTHPAPHYGVIVELREWSAPRPLMPPANANN